MSDPAVMFRNRVSDAKNPLNQTFRQTTHRILRQTEFKVKALRRRHVSVFDCVPMGQVCCKSTDRRL